MLAGAPSEDELSERRVNRDEVMPEVYVNIAAAMDRMTREYVYWLRLVPPMRRRQFFVLLGQEIERALSEGDMWLLMNVLKERDSKGGW